MLKKIFIKIKSTKTIFHYFFKPWQLFEDIPRKYEKRMALDKIFKCVRAWKLEGDYLEFGTYNGRTFTQAYELSKKYNIRNMRFIAFDSFKGLPKPNHKEKMNERFYQGQYSCSKDEFIEILKSSKVDLSKVKIISGYFDDTLNDELKKELKLVNAAIVWIDCDLYESTVPVLEFITDIIDNSTFVVFDDWFSFGGNPNMGEIKAFNEFVKKHPDIEFIEYDRFHTAGKIFLINKK